MSNFTILKNINLPQNIEDSQAQSDYHDIQDIIKLSADTYLFYSKKDIGILKHMSLKKIYRNVLPLGETISQVELLYKDLIAVSCVNKIMIFSTLTGKRVKELSFPSIEITSFLVQDKDTLLIAHKQYILKVNIFEGINNKCDNIIHRTKLDQPICKIHRKNEKEILIQTYYENLHVFNLDTKQITKYYYYDLPSRLFTDAVLFKNDILVSYSRGHTQVNRMNIRNGSNTYVENDLIIHQMKQFDEEQKYLISSFNNGKVALYERKHQKEVAVYQDENMTGSTSKHAVLPLKGNQLLVINSKCVRLVELEIVERNYCTFF